MVPMIVFTLVTRRELRTGESFAGYRDQIVVVESSMHYLADDQKCGPTVSVVGMLRNESDVEWKDIYLEAQYFDSGGTMIDAEGAEQYGLIVPAHEEVAFRVRGAAARAPKDYASHKVFVRSARDARSLF